MNDDAQIIYLLGATGCSKSLVAGLKFMDILLNAPKEETQFYMIFKDIGTGARNFLQNEDSFYNLFSFNREPATASKEGGLQFVFHGIYSDKIVYIVGANDKTAWSKILGSNPDGLWLEELSVLHIDLIRECMGRAISRKCRLIATSNGGLPTQEFYTEFVNHAVVQYPESVPAIEMAEMVQDKDYMHYYHFNLNDDAPHLTNTERNRLAELYPENSFYYMSKVMGCRGYVQGAAYASLMQKDTHIIPFEKIELSNLQEIGLFIDVGSSTNVDDLTKASTVGTLVGYSKNCQRIIVLECWKVNATSHDEIIKQFEENMRWWWWTYMQKFTKVAIDSAEAILIRTWAVKNQYRTIQIKGAVKSVHNIITLRTRCELKQQLIMTERLLWSTHAMDSYNAHTRILLTEDGEELDLANQDNDIADSLTYALTEKWNDITQETRRNYYENS
jgi:hypothetical protein